MQKIVFSLKSHFLICFCIFLAFDLQAGFNSAGLGNEKQWSDSSKNEVEKFAPSSKKREYLSDELKIVAENKKKFEDEIEGVNLVLGTDLPNSKKALLYLKKAFAQISIARIISIKRKNLKEMTAKEKDYLHEARKNCQEVIRLAPDNKNAQANAYYLNGLVDFEFDEFESGQKNLIYSLNLDNTRSQAGTIALMIAERFFETETFSEALKYYQSYYKKLTENQKVLADYKTAWAYIGLKENSKAEFYFLRVLANQKDKSFFEEALRDSAFIAAQYKQDSEIIEYANKIFKAKKLRAKYLTQVFRYLLGGSQKSNNQLLIDEIIKIEKDSGQKLQLLGLLVSRSRRDFVQTQSLQALYQISTELKNSDIGIEDKSFIDISKDLETDVEYFIRILSELYIGKIKLPIGTTKEKIGQGLIYTINWSLEYFPKSKKKSILYELLLDYCIDTKIFSCFDNLEKKITAELKLHSHSGSSSDSDSDSYLKPISLRLKIEILAVLDSEFQKDPGKFQVQYLERANEFILASEDNPKWGDVAKRIGHFYLKKEELVKAEPIFEKIYSKEKNAENFYRLLFCYFKNNQKPKIKGHPDLDKYNDERILALKREIFLDDAKEKGKSGDFVEYEKSLKLFLKSHPESKKAALAYADFYNKVLEKGDLDQFVKEWGSFDAEVSKQVVLEPIRLQAFNLFLDKGRLIDIFRLRQQDTHNKDLYYVNALASLLSSSFGDLWIADIAKLDLERKEYLLGLMALSQTQRVIDFFQKNEIKSDKEKQLLLLSYQIRDSRIDPNLSVKDRQRLSTLLPQKTKNEESHIENELKKFVFPEVRKKAELYGKDIEFLIGKTRRIRKQSLNELPHFTEGYRITLLDLLIANETNLYDAIQNSPRPPNLSASENDEYTKGLAEMADEYSKQAKEFSKIKSTLLEKIKRDIEEKKKNEIPSMDLKNWDWMGIAEKDSLLKLKNCYSGLCGLVYLDHLYNKKMLSESIYYKLKGGYLLSLHDSQTMRDYFQSELKSANQEAILVEWKRRAEKK